MRIIGPLDQKPFLGVAVAVVSGLMLGGAMKPELNETALFRAPQLLQPVSADRAEFVDGRATTAAYRYGVPEWVIGTDWLRPAQAEPYPEPVSDQEEAYEVAAWDAPEPEMRTFETSDAHEEAPAAEPSYPSMGGDILGGPRPEEPGDMDEAEPLAG